MFARDFLFGPVLNISLSSLAVPKQGPNEGGIDENVNASGFHARDLSDVKLEKAYKGAKISSHVKHCK